jgi:hypothetical protein
MPYRDQQRRLEAMRAYAQTEAGKAAKRRSHRNYIEKRRIQTSPLLASFVESLAREIVKRTPP